MSCEEDVELVNDQELKQRTSVKLPYFHRSLSSEDAALIGDIAPKKIESKDQFEEELENKLSNSSKWNSAGSNVSAHQNLKTYYNIFFERYMGGT